MGIFWFTVIFTALGSLRWCGRKLDTKEEKGSFWILVSYVKQTVNDMTRHEAWTISASGMQRRRRAGVSWERQDGFVEGGVCAQS